MSTPDNVNTFDGLPPEIICYIFDYLDFATLKSVSLTCHHLERIFSSYCCRRLMLYIGDDFYLIPPKNGRARAIFGSMDTLAKTTKHATIYYQNVYLPVQFKNYGCNLSMNNIFNEVLETDWLRQLVVLELGMGENSQDYNAQITAAVTKMDHLQELKLMHTDDTPDGDFFKKLKIENGTLQRLVLEIALPSVINCPKLRKLDVASHLEADKHFGKQYAQYGGQEPYWKLKQLEEFTIIISKMSPHFHLEYAMQRPSEYKFKFYQHLIQLRKFHIYETPVSGKFLQIICESCLHLEDMFISSLQASAVDSLRYLSNLTHFRRLGIWRSSPISFASVNCPKLEHLSVGIVNIVWESLEKIQSIKSLSIRSNPFETRPITELFARHMKQLEFVWLDFRFTRDPTKIFLVLQELPLLKTLILENLKVNDYLSLMPPLPQVTRLILYKCHTSQDMTEDAERFPNVKRIVQEVPELYACDYEKYLNHATMLH